MGIEDDRERPTIPAVAGFPPESFEPRDTIGDPFDDPAAGHPIRYGSGLTTFPLDPNIVTAVSAEQAIAIVTANGIFSSDLLGPHYATLRVVSVGFEGQDATFTPHVGWVVTRRGRGRPRGGPRPRPGQAPRPRGSFYCIFVSVVDATTGAIDGHHHQICRPSPEPRP